MAPSDIKRTLTLRDVSEASGVSEMTVSRVLRNRGDVSDATRDKVLEAAKRLGYVPNKIAGALASQRVNLVAVIVPSLSNLVFPEVLSGISEELEDTGLQPVFGVTNYSAEKEESVLYEMLSWRPSGVIVAGLEHSPNARAMLENSGIPIVEIMDVDGDAIDSVVGISHKRAGLEMARAIVKAYVASRTKAPWYIDLLNLNLDDTDLEVARGRIARFFELFEQDGTRLTGNLDFTPTSLD